MAPVLLSDDRRRSSWILLPFFWKRIPLRKLYLYLGNLAAGASVLPGKDCVDGNGNRKYVPVIFVFYL
jgi:hypothetical protein